MSNLLEQAKQLFDKELEENIKILLSRWRAKVLSTLKKTENTPVYRRGEQGEYIPESE